MQDELLVAFLGRCHCCLLVTTPLRFYCRPQLQPPALLPKGLAAGRREAAATCAHLCSSAIGRGINPSFCFSSDSNVYACVM
jgi:hypothetical protein